MRLFLASNIGGIKKENGKKVPVSFFENNNFLKNMKESINDYDKFVIIASDADNYEQNDYYLKLDMDVLAMSGINFKENVVLDNRNKDDIVNVFKNSSLIFLSGGDTLKQNIFFNEINLKEYIKNIDACIVGISAGAINSAKIVFNSPEEEKDLTNPSILEGLGLTTINVEPHFDCDKISKIQMDAILKESNNRVIYGLPDKSYIFNNKVYGKCYRVYKENIELISNDDEVVEVY
ncbi:MAG: Type 1 glutamine amidotransferase-like domain-containing protein [Firmicutes bacterium]|nr:Type 1 glutamine amidotransferase-like domain-containing protein [Bacillota bacterium]